jgi:hypothetical protein
LLTKTKPYLVYDLDNYTKKLLGANSELPVHGVTKMTQDFTKIGEGDKNDLDMAKMGNDNIILDYGR